MDMLIQNVGSAPVYYLMNKMEGGKPRPLPRIVFEGDKGITKISEEVYQAMLKNPFYKGLFERGVLIPLNGNTEIDSAVKDSLQTTELQYGKYVALVKAIKATTGTEADALRQFLDADGMPSFDLCKKNLGDGFEMNNLPQFRSRYLVEEANGMHSNTVILPTGNIIQAGAENVKTVNEQTKEIPVKSPKETPYEEMTEERLKAVADDLGVEYDENISFARLLKKVQKAAENKKN